MERHASTTRSRRGFVTIATGNKKYYQFAVNLLRSYRKNSNDDSPFALICDRDCEEAREFDSFVLIEDPHCSYLDKLSLYKYIPYDETIFIDADALILGNTQVLWSDFAQAEDVSCYGAVLPLESPKGWFVYESMGVLKPLLSFGVAMHGGLYYLRKTDRCAQFFAKALELVDHYYEYEFASFKKPADEPVIALALALTGWKPHAVKDPVTLRERITFLPYWRGKLKIRRSGELVLRGKKENIAMPPLILHFGSNNLSGFMYKWLVKIITHEGKPIPRKEYIRLRLDCLPTEMRVFIRNLLRKILPKKMKRALRNH